MAHSGRPSIMKRQKEQARAEKKRMKADQRAQRKIEKQRRRPGDPEEDPDLAGIVPGPQPLPWEEEDLSDDEEDED